MESDDENGEQMMKAPAVVSYETEEESKKHPQEPEDSKEESLPNDKSSNFPNNSKMDSSFGPDLNKEGSKAYSTNQPSESLKVDKGMSSNVNVGFPEFSKGKSDSFADYGLSKNYTLTGNSKILGGKESEVIGGIKQEEIKEENPVKNPKNNEENYENLIIFEEKSEKTIRVRK